MPAGLLTALQPQRRFVLVVTEWFKRARGRRPAKSRLTSKAEPAIAMMLPLSHRDAMASFLEYQPFRIALTEQIEAPILKSHASLLSIVDASSFVGAQLFEGCA
jgi:hypothetical protein